ncbi:hypothetical protein [Kitasatospora sp. NPDC050543]|uniref:hypothetical protein n=1 Tax=Kitasatospora sp. NPDC050543 TaxID=3364054 RepID=UPI0037BCEB58
MTESDIRSSGVPDRPPGRGRPGSAARAASALLAVLLAVTALVACSSSKSSGTASTAASTSAAASPSASASGSAPADVAAAEAQVKQNWEKFFDPAIPLADKAALLQNGDQLAPALQGFAQDPRVGQVKAQVTGVTFTSPTDATVTYSLSLQGTVVEPSATGQAVLDNGTWKVSRSSLCGLVAQSGNTAVPGCS